MPGLSLCIQGTHLTTYSISHPMRFIPVYTGNTDLISYMDKLFAVYPCVYREHVSDDSIIDSVNGLSLCIQGTPLTRQ